MDDNELPKKILWTKPRGQQGRDRPKSRCVDGVGKDAREPVCSNWLATAQDRGRRRHLLEEAKDHPAGDDDNDDDDDDDDDDSYPASRK